MAANDEFPRGWSISNQVVGPGGGATIVVPAAPGVSHVLDSFDCKIQGPASQGGSILVTTSGGTFSNYPIGQLTSPGGVDSASGGGLNLSTQPGESLQVATNFTTPAGDAQLLTINGHDI